MEAKWHQDVSNKSAHNDNDDLLASSSLVQEKASPSLQHVHRSNKSVLPWCVHHHYVEIVAILVHVSNSHRCIDPSADLRNFPAGGRHRNAGRLPWIVGPWMEAKKSYGILKNRWFVIIGFKNTFWILCTSTCVKQMFDIVVYVSFNWILVYHVYAVLSRHIILCYMIYCQLPCTEGTVFKFVLSYSYINLHLHYNIALFHKQLLQKPYWCRLFVLHISKRHYGQSVH